ncbi:4'-phosphopantetheinyl transferase family protein [Undibacterium sp. Di27W]|uniref:4'-phosphopantetheinyl transferase family protein n=1 Tax=Undibacterium sp. Di27W TaxID=3413036 RepID=UPI003BF2AE84
MLDTSTLTDLALQSYQHYLNVDEALRYQRFVRRERQRQFLAGRVLLRRSLGQLLKVPHTSLRLIEQRNNAPLLDWPDSPDIGFSLSHSGNWVACAVSATSRLGLDIELLNPARDFSALALHVFDAEENACLNQQDQADRMHDFYRLWTSKEAHIKLNVPSAQCIQLAHTELSITLCSARQLTATPQLLQTSLSVE